MQSITSNYPVIIYSVEVVENPLGIAFSFINFAAPLAAAITEGSSVTIGTISSLPLITKFKPRPRGRLSFPIQFSTMRSARRNGNPPDSNACLFSPSEYL